MPRLFEAETADTLWVDAAKELLSMPVEDLQPSRQGKTHELLHCCLHLKKPRQRWVLSRQPAINPAFAIAELIWILSGRDDAAFPNYWNPLLPKYSGKQNHYYGAYGARLKNHFGIDQLHYAYETLLHKPDSRQVVLQIWDGVKDLPNMKGEPRNADIPCNIASMLKVRFGKLEWSQVMRSNDLYRGTPHNIIQFSSLQEIMAGWLQLELGSFSLFTDSLHLYEQDIKEIYIRHTEVNLNNDSLMFSKSEYDEILPVVGNYMDELKDEQLSKKRFINITLFSQLPIAWKNLITITAADSARRRGWFNEMEEAAHQCNNPMLKMAWKNWLKRKIDTVEKMGDE